MLWQNMRSENIIYMIEFQLKKYILSFNSIYFEIIKLKYIKKSYLSSVIWNTFANNYRVK